MTTYPARCEWDGEAWIVTGLAGAPSIRARCAELHQAYDRLAETAHLVTGEPLASITVRVEQIVGSAAIDRAAVVRALRDSAAAAVRDAEAATGDVVGVLRCAGFGYRDIAAMLGMSSHRVRQSESKAGRRHTAGGGPAPAEQVSHGLLNGRPDG